MFQRRTQIWMVVLAGLLSDPLFDKLKLILYRCEESD
jgi:hypothetical protein